MVVLIFCCVLQKEEADKAAQEEAERKEGERLEKVKREEEERIARKKVRWDASFYQCVAGGGDRKEEGEMGC